MPIAGTKFFYCPKVRNVGSFVLKKSNQDFNFSYNLEMASKDLNFLTTTPEIFKALLQSKDDCTSIAIRVNALGPDPIVTCVEDIIFEDIQTLIILKYYDSTGYLLPSRKINLLEIQGVYPFSTPFVNPYLENVAKDRSWYF
jgi:hypothetical protein